jgi:hypothetical protein
VLASLRRVPPPALLDGAIALALAGAAAALYAPVLRLWWTHDDVFNLRTLLTYRPYWYLWSAADYQRMQSGIFTPLLFLSLDLDRRWFGIDPRPFQLHQLATLSLCAVTFYGAARQWLARPWAAAAAWLFLVGPVTASMASMLMVRHYQESLVLTALSVTAWAAALRRWPGAGARRWAWLSAALYFAASLAKEIAVPLVALLPLLPSPGPPVGRRARTRLALPHVTACAVYLAVRLALVSRPFETYGFVVAVSDLPALGLALPGKIARELAGGPLSFAAVLLASALAAGLAGLAVAPSRRRAAATTGLALLLAAAPVLPVSIVMEPRYAAPSWVVVVVAFALGCRALATHGAGARRRCGAVAIALVACAAGLWLNREDWPVRFAVAERISAENRFVLDMGAEDVLRQPLAVGASLRELEWMKEAVYGRPRGGEWFQDDLFLCLHDAVPGRVAGWDADARRVIDLTPRLPALRRRHCTAIRSEAALKASFRVRGTDLFWELGPHGSGIYRFVLDDGRIVVPIPVRAGYHMAGWPVGLALWVAYESPAGWVTYSPALSLRLVDGSTLGWSRP